MAAKKITLDWSETGKTVYAIIRREADNFLMDDADGTFGAAPSDPYLALAEDPTIKGRYEASEGRQTWDDGRYTLAVYKQVGGSPAPASDTIIGTGEMWVSSDAEVAPGALLNFVEKWIVNRLVESPDGATITLYDDDDITPLKTWTYDQAAKTRSKAI